MPETWFALAHDDLDPAENMAWDEVLLETAGQLGGPVLRTYGWREPAATFGYFQRWREIATLTNLRPLIRRPTGGGLVRHENDWTYALVLPAGHPWHRLRAVASYERLHTWLQRALARLDVVTRLAPAPQLDGPGQCFIGAERHDLLHAGRKLAGAAQRRTRRGLLIQGSVQPAPPGLTRAAWHAALRETATADWGVHWRSLPPETERARAAAARQRAAEKFARPEYNQRR